MYCTRECAVASEWPIILLLYRRQHAYVQHQSKAHVWDWDGPAASLPTPPVTCVPPLAFGFPSFSGGLGCRPASTFSFGSVQVQHHHTHLLDCCCCSSSVHHGWCKKTFEFTASVVRLSRDQTHKTQCKPVSNLLRNTHAKQYLCYI
jgi:hypothetical protein